MRDPSRSFSDDVQDRFAGVLLGTAVGDALGVAGGGKGGLPPELIAGVCERPRSVSLLEQIATRLAQQKDSAQTLGPVRYFWPGLILRNLLFVVVVLIHGFRRLAPPY